MTLVAAIERRTREPHPLRLGDGAGDVAVGGPEAMLRAFARAVAPHFGPADMRGRAPWTLHLSPEPLGDAGPGQPLFLARSHVRDVPGDVRTVEGWRIVRNHRSGALVALRDGALVVGPERPSDPCDLLPDACSALRALARGRDEHAGGALFHAACAAFEGRGVLVVGAKGGGKSTLLAALLARGGAYVAGDRTMVRSASGRCVGAGCIDPLRLGEPARSILGLAPGVPGPGGKHHLSASELRDRRGVALASTTPLALVVTVAWGRQAVGDALSDAVLTPRDPVYPDWLAVRPTEPSAAVVTTIRGLPRLDLHGEYTPEEGALRVLERLGGTE